MTPMRPRTPFVLAALLVCGVLLVPSAVHAAAPEAPRIASVWAELGVRLLGWLEPTAPAPPAGLVGSSGSGMDPDGSPTASSGHGMAPDGSPTTQSGSGMDPDGSPTRQSGGGMNPNG